MLALGKQRKRPQEEETSCDSTPHSTRSTVASTCTPGPWSLGSFNQDGEVVLHRHMRAAPEPFLQAIVPSREDIVVCVEGIFTGYWLADLCTQEGMPFVLGHALYMKAIHGGKAKHDTIDAHKIAVLLRGGMLPQASVDPAERRATRDVLRRRMHLTRKRAELWAHSQHTHSQYNLPAISQKRASQANRAGVAERFPEPAVQQSLAVDLALIHTDDHWLTDRERSLVKTTKAPDAQIFYRRRSIPGVGQILALVLLDEIHDSHRFPRVQEFVSSGRLVTCAKDSAGKRDGTSGQTIGHADLKWAFSEAAVRFLRHHPAGQKDRARLTNKHGQGKALTVLAHTWARAVYDMWTRDTAFDLEKFLQESWRGAGEPDASLDTHGISLP
jgi:transposase